MNEGGTKHDQDKIPLDLIPKAALDEISKVLGFGAQKYDRHNWRRGIKYSRLIAAALRHITAFNDGEDSDAESGLSHIAHGLCCLAFLQTFIKEDRKELDDRYIRGSLTVKPLPVKERDGGSNPSPEASPAAIKAAGMFTEAAIKLVDKYHTDRIPLIDGKGDDTNAKKPNANIHPGNNRTEPCSCGRTSLCDPK